MKLIVVFEIAPESVKCNLWHDGFTKALEILAKEHEIDRLNIAAESPVRSLSEYDLVLLKCGFGSRMLSFVPVWRPKKLAICVSSVRPPNYKQMRDFDLIFYETQWYKKYANLEECSNIHHAFGVDTDVMKPLPNEEKLYDYIFVGSLKQYKRPTYLIEKPGRKLAIGMGPPVDIPALRQTLQNGGVQVETFMPYEELAKKYNQARRCYVPCTTFGGGERCVLEARACGLEVEIEGDNPKLQELLESPIWSAQYYADQLNKGFRSLTP